ncbi:TerD family protein [Pseudonocardia lacus]|jgi:tellurium resistance protein TerD|uniref:TerD family protein n=1 Tax=Pseudonocardia lacus TaxID=2835865 RepID=UPI001BDDB3E9|nr:TerD family protein [Pseudonocardia lacus]
MPVSLTKGGNISLTKEVAKTPGAAPLTAVTVGLGWDARTTDGAKFDLDAVALGLGADGKVLGQDGFIFFNQLVGAGGAIQHTGDNRSGEGEGDDEQIKVDLANLPAGLEKVVFAVVIFDGETNGQTFGQVRNAFVRVVNQADSTEIARYDLSEDSSTAAAMIFSELYKNGDDWKFRAVGDGYSGGLAALAKDYGVDV